MIDVESLHGRRADQRWNRISVGDVLERTAIHSPDREAIVGAPGAFGYPEMERLSYRQADELANRFANALLERGLERGDRVIFVTNNSVESVVAKIGVAKAGGVVTAVNPAQTKEVFEYVFDLTKPRFCIVDSEYADKLALLKNVTAVISIPIGGPVVPGTLGFLEFVDGQSSAAPEDIIIHGDDIWEILPTSGTTSMPKGVMISHTYTYLNSMSWGHSMSRGLVDERDLRFACFTPTTFHITDTVALFPAWFVGGTIVIGRRYDPELIAQTIQKERLTGIYGAGISMVSGNLLPALESVGKEGLSSLTYIVAGIGTISADVTDRLYALVPGLHLQVIAGQTEATVGHRFMISADREMYAKSQEKETGLIGRPSPLLGSKIDSFEKADRPGPPTSVGELVTRSPVMMSGYYLNAEATAEAFAGGWFRTGDVAYEDEFGVRHMVGRTKEMVKTGGENVACVRVESIISKHPAVANVAVIGVPDERWGEAVAAAVEVVEGSELSEEEIIAFARGQLAGFETPKRIFLVDDIPRDFNGKIQRVKPRETCLALLNDE